jgi:chromosome segregation ATPase
METATSGTDTRMAFEAVLERAERLSPLLQDKAQWERELSFAERNVEALFKAGKIPSDEFRRFRSEISRCEQQIAELKNQVRSALASWVRELEELDERESREVVIPGRAKLKSLLEQAIAICESLRSSRQQIADKTKELNANRHALAAAIQESAHNFNLPLDKFFAQNLPGIRREDHAKGDLESILRSVSSQL